MNVRARDALTNRHKFVSGHVPEFCDKVNESGQHLDLEAGGWAGVAGVVDVRTFFLQLLHRMEDLAGMGAGRFPMYL